MILLRFWGASCGAEETANRPQCSCARHRFPASATATNRSSGITADRVVVCPKDWRRRCARPALSPPKPSARSLVGGGRRCYRRSHITEPEARGAAATGLNQLL